MVLLLLQLKSVGVGSITHFCTSQLQAQDNPLEKCGGSKCCTIEKPFTCCITCAMFTTCRELLP